MTSSSKPTGSERPLHRTTFSLGDQTKTIYSTTHTESFSGRTYGEQPLMFLLRDPGSSVDISSIPTGPSYASTHSRDVHCPKAVIPQNILRSLSNRNRARNDEGLAMKEVTNPPEPTPYISTYHTHHRHPAAHNQPAFASGRSTSCHKHNILTGEERGSADPSKQNRQSRERQLWAARRWETGSCTSLRLY